MLSVFPRVTSGGRDILSVSSPHPFSWPRTSLFIQDLYLPEPLVLFVFH